MNSQIRILIACSIALLVTQMLALSLATGGDTIQAQNLLPSENSKPARSPAVMLPNADGQKSLPLTKVAPNGPAEPDSPQSPGAAYSYYFIMGTAFHAVSSSSSYAYGDNGCIYQTTDPVVRFQAPLIIPPGSEVKFVRFYYYDASIYDMTVWLTRYEPGVSNLDLASAASSGTAGFGSALSNLISETVDTGSYAYALNWGAISPTSSGQQICGVRVAYYAPQGFGTFLPLIGRNP